MNLSAHFTLSELTRSVTAERYHIDNTPNKEQIENLRQLCINVLEPLREHAGRPIRISSGFRSAALNAHPEVRGASNSQHLCGEAVDIHIPTEEIGKEWFMWAVSNLHFDQIIWEKPTRESRHHWIHISYRQGNCRQSVIWNLIKNK